MLFPNVCKVCVCPGDGTISFEFGPVIVPVFRSVECLCYVVIAFAMAAHVEEFVAYVVRTAGVEMLDIAFKAFPRWIFGSL